MNRKIWVGVFLVLVFLVVLSGCGPLRAEEPSIPGLRFVGVINSAAGTSYFYEWCSGPDKYIYTPNSEGRVEILRDHKECMK